MVQCVAFGCKNHSKKKLPRISFHKFPQNADLFRKWIIAVKRKNWQPTKCTRLCSEHFDESQMDRTSLTSIRLRENAVPTIFKGLPSSFQNAIAIVQHSDTDSDSDQSEIESSSTEVSRVKKKIKREEEEITEEKPLNNHQDILVNITEKKPLTYQEKILENVKDIGEQLESIATKQTEILREMEKANEHLNLISHNVSRLVQLACKSFEIKISTKHE